MMENVKMKDCHFMVNKEKRTIVCFITGTKDMFIDFVCMNAPNQIDLTYREMGKFKMNNKFIGTAYCAEEDEWDEETGKRLAFYRMKRKLFDSFYNKIRLFFDEREKQLDQFEDTCVNYRNKVEASISRQVEKIAKLTGVNDYDIEGGAYGYQKN